MTNLNLQQPLFIGFYSFSSSFSSPNIASHCAGFGKASSSDSSVVDDINPNSETSGASGKDGV